MSALSLDEFTTGPTTFRDADARRPRTASAPEPKDDAAGFGLREEPRTN